MVTPIFMMDNERKCGKFYVQYDLDHDLDHGLDLDLDLDQYVEFNF